jgi:hypothetical protein
LLLVTPNLAEIIVNCVRLHHAENVVFMEADLLAVSADRQIPAWAILFE